MCVGELLDLVRQYYLDRFINARDELLANSRRLTHTAPPSTMTRADYQMISDRALPIGASRLRVPKRDIPGVFRTPR
jgi:hypothetical protein